MKILKKWLKIKKNIVKTLLKFNKVLMRIWKLEMKKEGNSLQLYYNSERRYAGLRGVNWVNFNANAHSTGEKGKKEN